MHRAALILSVSTLGCWAVAVDARAATPPATATSAAPAAARAPARAAPEPAPTPLFDLGLHLVRSYPAGYAAGGLPAAQVASVGSGANVHATLRFGWGGVRAAAEHQLLDAREFGIETNVTTESVEARGAAQSFSLTALIAPGAEGVLPFGEVGLAYEWLQHRQRILLPELGPSYPASSCRSTFDLSGPALLGAVGVAIPGLDHLVLTPALRVSVGAYGAPVRGGCPDYPRPPYLREFAADGRYHATLSLALGGEFVVTR